MNMYAVFREQAVIRASAQRGAPRAEIDEPLKVMQQARIPRPKNPRGTPRG